MEIILHIFNREKTRNMQQCKVCILDKIDCTYFHFSNVI